MEKIYVRRVIGKITGRDAEGDVVAHVNDGGRELVLLLPLRRYGRMKLISRGTCYYTPDDQKVELLTPIRGLDKGEEALIDLSHVNLVIRWRLNEGITRARRCGSN